MKFAHISDLHLGIDLNSFSLQEDQKFILDEILKIAEEEKIDGIFIAGDIFDRAIAPVEAINTFVDFLTRLQEKNIKVFCWVMGFYCIGFYKVLTIPILLLRKIIIVKKATPHPDCIYSNLV